MRNARPHLRMALRPPSLARHPEDRNGPKDLARVDTMALTHCAGQYLVLDPSPPAATQDDVWVKAATQDDVWVKAGDHSDVRVKAATQDDVARGLPQFVYSNLSVCHS